MTEKTEALRLADRCKSLSQIADAYSAEAYEQAAAELSRLSAENASLRQIVQDFPPVEAELREVSDRAHRLEAQRDALLEAAREGLSVCRSVSIRHDRRITRDGCLLYAQTEEWCRWAEAEVGPKIDAAIKAVEENT